jgi:hypothetical protein
MTDSLIYYPEEIVMRCKNSKMVMQFQKILRMMKSIPTLLP